MSLERAPFLQLLMQVVEEPPYWPDEALDPETYANFIPADLWPPNSDYTSKYLRLHSKSANLYDQCLAEMIAESQDGDLEQLTERESVQSLWRLVSEAWLGRDGSAQKALEDRVENYLASIRVPQHDWEVLWEIDWLEVAEPISIEDVEFLQFSKDAIAGWDRPTSESWNQIEQSLVGRTFARVQVRAGTKDKALARGKPIIDDALEILRLAVSGARTVPAPQRLQRRGKHYFAYPMDGRLGGGGAGAVATSMRGSLTVSGNILTTVRRRLGEFGPVLSAQLPGGIREPVRRAIIAVGQSMTRDEPDTQILDLCSALESLLCGEKDALKAERIALRYMLFGLAIGDDSFVTHPLEIYDLYIKRNKIIHGSDRRVCTQGDYTSLLYVANDTIERVVTVATGAGELEDMDALFAHVETVDSLESASEFLRKYPVSKDDAAKYLGRLTDWWLSRAKLQAAVTRRDYTVREILLPRSTQVVVIPPGSRMQKAIKDGRAINVADTDPGEANREALRQFQDRFAAK